MIRKFLMGILGFSATILSAREGDTLIFEAREDMDRATLEWFEVTLRKYFKRNIVILQGMQLKQVLRKERNLD